jgi:hypothetical protein
MAEGLSTRGLYYLVALLMVTVVTLFGLLLRVQAQRLSDLAAHGERLRELQDTRVQLVQTVVPVAKDLAMGAIALKAVARDLLDATPPRRRRELPPEKEGA